jgi:magnesium-protoporphyrin O-methyltransferase
MTETSYHQRRGQIEKYFDRTAAQAWAQLTSDAKVSRVRATVRAGREQMRTKLLSWLPSDLRGRRILDAGCGTGTLAVEAARRGADVVAVDLSPTLIALAQERTPIGLIGTIEFIAGDMFHSAPGRFDHIVAMDSLIHYQAPDAVQVLDGLASRADSSLLFTFVPKTRALEAMHLIGRLFPRGDRAPAIEPVAEAALLAQIHAAAGLMQWTPGRTQRISSGFYTSQAMELTKS